MGVNRPPLSLQLVKVCNGFTSAQVERTLWKTVEEGRVHSAKLQLRNEGLNLGPFGTWCFRLSPSLAALQHAELWCAYYLVQMWPISGP